MSPASDRLTYVGHATVLVELSGARLLTDPMLRPGLLGVIRRVAAPPPPGATDALDAVLISHLHPDHLDFPSLFRLGRETPVVVPSGGGRTLKRRGLANRIELAPGEATEIGGVTVEAVGAEHEGRRYGVGPRVPALGYVLSAGERRIYFAGDTDLFEGMHALAGDLDVALLPISGWGPKVNPGHLDPRRAAEAAAILRPRVAIPIHWGTLLRADLRWRRPELLTEPAHEFAAEAAKLAPDVEARVLEPGESLELDSPPA